MVLSDGSTVLWVTAATSLAVAFLTLLIPHRVGRIDTTNARKAAVASSGWAQLRDGWRVLFRSRFLVVTTVLSAVSLIVIVEDFAAELAPVLLNEPDPLELGKSASLLSDYTTDVLNEQQQRVLDQLAAMLEQTAPR
ncbi:MULTISPECIES: hypothetical protein [Bacteria]|jgi:hypothetical protein